MLSLCLLCAAPASARVLLIGIDGGSWNVIDPMIARGELPNLAALMQRGVHAELETVEPLISPAVWTSIATGRSPKAHGIGDFYATRLRRKTPTVFERLAASGRRVGTYDFLMTWPPASFPGGFVIPGWLRRDESVSPPDVWQRIDLSPFASDYTDLRSSDDYLKLARREVVSKAERWNALAEAFDIELGATTFYAADMTSHRFWRAGYPEQFDDAAPGAANPVYAAAISEAMKGIDRAVGEIVAAQAPGDTVLIVSDHGFHAADEARRVWVTSFREVAANMSLRDREGFSVQTVFGVVIVRVHPGEFAQQEALLDRLLELFASFESSDGTALLSANLIDVAERPASARRPLLQRLRQWATRLVVEHWFDVELDPAAHAYLFAFPAADRLDSLWPDSEIAAGGRKMAARRVFTPEEFTGEHDPIGIFLAAGAPIAGRPERARISVLDIAPLIHYLAGDRIPDDLEGELPRSWIEASHLEAHPVRTGKAADFPAIPGDPSADGGPVDAELTEKLRALGYVR